MSTPEHSLVQRETRVTPQQSEDEFTRIMDRLSPEQKADAEKLALEIRPEDSNSITQFGTAIQGEISRFSGQVLEHIQAKDADVIGDQVTDLMLKVKDVDVESLSEDNSFLSRVPVIGKLFDRAQRVLQQYQSVESHVNTIVSQLDKSYIQLHKDISLLDQVYEKNYEYFQNLEVYIGALQIRLEKVENEELPALRKKAEESKDPMVMQQLQALSAFANRIDKKLDDFRRSRFISVNNAPQIKLIQNGNQVLMEKIQSIVYNLIPLWKMDIVTGITQLRTAKSLKMAKDVRNTIEQSMVRNAENLKTLSLSIAKESEEGIVSIDTLKKVHEHLLTTLTETQEALEQGKQQRQNAAKEMNEMEEELKHKIAELAGREASVNHSPETHS